MSGLPPEADIRQRIEHVCFVPEADIRSHPGRPAAHIGALRAIDVGGMRPKAFAWQELPKF